MSNCSSWLEIKYPELYKEWRKDASLLNDFIGLTKAQQDHVMSLMERLKNG